MSDKHIAIPDIPLVRPNEQEERERREVEEARLKAIADLKRASLEKHSIAKDENE